MRLKWPKIAVTEIGHVSRYAEMVKNGPTGLPFKMDQFSILDQYKTKNGPFWYSQIVLGHVDSKKYQNGPF